MLIINWRRPTVLFGWICMLAIAMMISSIILTSSAGFYEKEDADLSFEAPLTSTTVRNNAKATKTVLWLAACETRAKNDGLERYFFSARQVLKMASNNYDTNTTLKHGKFSNYMRGGNHNIDVRVINICDNVEWKGRNTKLETMLEFTKIRVSQQTKEAEEEIIMFTDSDSYFNPWAVTLEEVIERFHKAREGKQILISAEPNCWVGHHCTVKDYKILYPNAMNRSSCPQFANSGQYMGYASALVPMLKEQLVLDPEILKPGRVDDQGIFTLWYNLNTDKAALDLKASIFRSMVFGAIDVNVKGGFSCGRTAQDCGKLDPPKGGFVNTSTLEINMNDVDVNVCGRAEIRPFSIHGNGPSLSTATKLFKMHTYHACQKDPTYCAPILWNGTHITSSTFTRYSALGGRFSFENKHLAK